MADRVVNTLTEGKSYRNNLPCVYPYPDLLMIPKYVMSYPNVTCVGVQ